MNLAFSPGQEQVANTRRSRQRRSRRSELRGESSRETRHDNSTGLMPLRQRQVRGAGPDHV